jgi:3-dehydroquinate dehydratase
VLLDKNHSIWGTASGRTLSELCEAESSLLDAGVEAVEIRADLLPGGVYDARLESSPVSGPTFIAHFGIEGDSILAAEELDKATRCPWVTGIICHSHHPEVEALADLAVRAGKAFACAYHSQLSLTSDEVSAEYSRQSQLGSLFLKIAIRPRSIQDCLSFIDSVNRSASTRAEPVVGAVFGPHRWARIAMIEAGSAITFVVAHQCPNEIGGDDEQFTVAELGLLKQVRSLVPN